MNISRVNTLVERAADALARLAEELRQVSGNPRSGQRAFGLASGEWDACDSGDEGRQCACGLRKGAGAGARVDPLARIRSFWEGVSMAPVMAFGEQRIDLATAQGRWELLVLAVLLGARVTERVVEKTFAALRTEGLVDPDRLAESPDCAREALRAVLQREYRALGNKEGKVDALIYNARRLLDECRGDLHTIYLAAKGAALDAGTEAEAPLDEEALIRSLQSFRHIKQLAFWVCRTLKAHGIWRDLTDRATAYRDRYTRLPVERLGLPPLEAGELVEAGVMPLYLQGFNLCSQDDVKTCLAECPVAAWCPYPQGRSKSE